MLVLPYGRRMLIIFCRIFASCALIWLLSLRPDAGEALTSQLLHFLKLEVEQGLLSALIGQPCLERREFKASRLLSPYLYFRQRSFRCLSLHLTHYLNARGPGFDSIRVVQPRALQLCFSLRFRLVIYCASSSHILSI